MVVVVSVWDKLSVSEKAEADQDIAQWNADVDRVVSQLRECQCGTKHDELHIACALASSPITRDVAVLLLSVLLAREVAHGAES